MFELLAAFLPPPQRSPGEVLRPFGWVVVVSLLVSALATPLLRALARRLKIVDKPDSFLKPHGRPIAYLGGIAVYLGWLTGMFVFFPDQLAARTWIAGLALAGGVVVLVGLADDLLGICPAFKLAGQALAAVILLVFGIGREIIMIAVTALKLLWPELAVPEVVVVALSAPISVVLVVAASNAANLLDGMDGLCSGVTGIISLMFVILATHLAMYGYSEARDPARIVASLAMLGAVCGFLPYNLTPATIFLGDAGSMLVGLYAAAMMLMFGERHIPKWVLGSVMIFGLPILDTSLALIRRIRLRRSIFEGDRSHLYDQLVDRGYTVRQTLAISYGLSIFYGLAGVAIILTRTRYAAPAYILVGAITLYICHRLGILKPPKEAPRESADPAGGDGLPSG